jgi:hypothetical protein
MSGLGITAFSNFQAAWKLPAQILLLFYGVSLLSIKNTFDDCKSIVSADTN